MTSASSVRQTYIVVLAAWVATVAIQVLLYGNVPHLISFMPALVASAYVAGLRSGLPATAVAALAALWLGRGTIEGIDWPDWAALVATGAAASVACELLHRARRRAEHARDHEHRTKLVLLDHLSEQRQVGDRVRQTLHPEAVLECTDELAKARLARAG
ncbi:MAG: hypothetical protein H6Q90_6785 [Deltaproteobacteria bacterium]|nr:hypothetical protein [Deltaproteobacteria bacterium]